MHVRRYAVPATDDPVVTTILATPRKGEACNLHCTALPAFRTFPGYRRRPSLDRLRLLLELERLVQHAHRELDVLLVDHDGDLDFGRRDHLDVDALLRQRL